LFFSSKQGQEAIRKSGLAAEAQEKAFFGHTGLIGVRFQAGGKENPGGEDIPIRLLLMEL